MQEGLSLLVVKFEDQKLDELFMFNKY